MKFTVDWHKLADNLAPEERATVADLRVFIQEANICDHLCGDQRELTDHVTVSVYPMAEGIALDWWNIFGRRNDKYKLIRRRGGYVIPDIFMHFDGGAFEFGCVAHDDHNAFVWFPRNESEILQRGHAEKELTDFIEKILKRLDDEGISESGLQLRWERVRASLENPDEVAFCEAAGALRLDPYDLSESDAKLILQANDFFQGEPLVEFLSALHGPGATDALDWIEAVERRPRYRSQLPVAKHLRDALSSFRVIREGERAWARGYRCARAARQELNLTESDRLASGEELADRLEAPKFESAPTFRGLRALVNSKDNRVDIHLSDTVTQHGKTAWLFGFGRALGEVVANPPAPRAVVNNLRDASRQAANRAFAAEFLAPVNEILTMHEDSMDISAIAVEFGVSDQVIMRQIENSHNIEWACSTG